jgi:hypothetical protein
MGRREIEDIIRSRGGSVGIDFRAVNCAGANLSELNLAGVIFDEADLGEVSFIGTDLTGARLRGANLTDAVLWEANLKGTQLQRANLWRTDLAYSHLYETVFSREELGGKVRQELEQDFLAAREVFHMLKRNFSSIGHYDDSSWAYFKERQMLRKSLGLTHAFKAYPEAYPEITCRLSLDGDWSWRTRFHYLSLYARRHLGSWAYEMLNEIAWGSGERPLRAVLLSALIIVLFAFLYRLIGGFEASTSTQFVDYLNYSIAAFVTMSYSNLVPITRAARLLSSVEAALGIICLSTFLFALGQRISSR